MQTNRGEENSMKKWWFNSMVFKKELERRYGINKSMNNLGPIENTRKSEDPNRKAKNIHSWRGRANSSYSNGDPLVGLNDTFLVRDSNGNNYSIYWDIFSIIFDIENMILVIDELDMDDPKYSLNHDINSYLKRRVDYYLRSQIYMDPFIVSDSSESEKSGIRTHTESSDTESSALPLSESSDTESSDTESSDTESSDTGSSDTESSALPLSEGSNNPERPKDFSHLWVYCENCERLNYKKFFLEKKYICEICGSHVKMNSPDRIEISIDPGTWHPIDEHLDSLDAIGWDEVDECESNTSNPANVLDSGEGFGFNLDSGEGLDVLDSGEGLDVLDSGEGLDVLDSGEGLDVLDSGEGLDVLDSGEGLDVLDSGEEEVEEVDDEPYTDRLASYQSETGLTEAVQTGVGLLNGIPIAMAVMDFRFMGGSMGSVVGEKITRLIEFATNERLPLIIVCASGGARMQEGSLSLMQMAKISSALYDFQSNKKLFYISILASPTTGGVTASFGMLGDIIIAEPNAYIAFAGKRVIEQTLNIEVPEGVQETEYLFEKGAFDLIVPRTPLKSVLSELFQLHGYFPLN